MTFYRVLARLAAQLLLGLAVFLWGAIALFDVERAATRPWFALGAVLALVALAGIAYRRRWASGVGAVALIVPIGVLADGNGASRWLWLLWFGAIWATERWVRDGVRPGRPDAG